MSTTNAPYGLRPINRNDGMPYAGATSQYLINPTSGAGTNLFYGQVVLIDADGYIALSTATGADLTTNNLGGSSIGASHTQAAMYTHAPTTGARLTTSS